MKREEGYYWVKRVDDVTVSYRVIAYFNGHDDWIFCGSEQEHDDSGLVIGQRIEPPVEPCNGECGVKYCKGITECKACHKFTNHLFGSGHCSVCEHEKQIPVRETENRAPANSASLRDLALIKVCHQIESKDTSAFLENARAVYRQKMVALFDAACRRLKELKNADSAISPVTYPYSSIDSQALSTTDTLYLVFDELEFRARWEKEPDGYGPGVVQLAVLSGGLYKDFKTLLGLGIILAAENELPKTVRRDP